MNFQDKKKCTLLIKNCKLINSNLKIIDESAIAINNDCIVDLGPISTIEANYDPDDIIDAKGKVASPGMIDCHTHSVQQFLRGGVLGEPPVVWMRVLVPFEASCREQDIYHASRLSCLQMLKNGITTFADSGVSDISPMIQAIQEMGIRATVTRNTRDMGDFLPSKLRDSSPEEAIRKTEEMYKEFNGSGDGRVNVWFSATSTTTTSPKLGRLVTEAAKEYNTGILCHMSESMDEVAECIKQYGMRPPEYFDSCGILGTNVVAAHCVYITDFDIHLMAKRKANIIHCPTANLSDQGFPKLLAERAAGLNIGIGNDGAAIANLDNFPQMQLLKYATQAAQGTPVYELDVLPVEAAFKMSTSNNAKALMKENEIGSLEIGKKADVILIDTNQPLISPNKNLFKTLVMNGSGRDVTDVIVNGEVIIKDRDFVSIDEEEVVRTATDQFNDFWNQ